VQVAEPFVAWEATNGATNSAKSGNLAITQRRLRNMSINFSRTTRPVPFAFTVCLALFAAGAGGTSAVAAPSARPSLASVVKKLSAGSTPSRSSVEKTLGVKLKQIGSTGSFVIYKSSARVLADARLVEVELRVPRKGADVTAGPLLIIGVDDSAERCIDRTATLKTYAPLELTQVPSGNSLDETTVYSRTQAWGTFAVGFAERSPECLGTITFSHDL
jgi:hypothetical protein